MLVQTTRFGAVDVDEERIIHFPAGLLGFSSYRRYALLQPDDQGIFFWLQSIEAPDLAFVVSGSPTSRPRSAASRWRTWPSAISPTHRCS
jgi:flagellar assembly factor FliW